jgi:DNA-binding MarR family transcriptional regulator
VTRRLDAMESRGLVERLPDPDDGRAKLARLTEAGRALAARALERSDARNRRLHDAFSTGEWQTLTLLLRRLGPALE